MRTTNKKALSATNKIALSLLLLGSNLAFAGQGSMEIGIELSPVGDFQITGDKLSGGYVKQGDKLIAQNVSVAIKSLTSDNDTRDKHIQKYFEAEKFPVATLEKAVGSNSSFVGVLNVHGQKSQIKGTYTLKGDMLHAEFKTTMSAFKIEKASFMGVSVKDEVLVKVVVPPKK